MLQIERHFSRRIAMILRRSTAARNGDLLTKHFFHAMEEVRGENFLRPRASDCGDFSRRFCAAFPCQKNAARNLLADRLTATLAVVQSATSGNTTRTFHTAPRHPLRAVSFHPSLAREEIALSAIVREDYAQRTGQESTHARYGNRLGSACVAVGKTRARPF